MSSNDNHISDSNGTEWFSDAVSVVGEVIGFWGFRKTTVEFGHFYT